MSQNVPPTSNADNAMPIIRHKWLVSLILNDLMQPSTVVKKTRIFGKDPLQHCYLYSNHNSSYTLWINDSIIGGVYRLADEFMIWCDWVNRSINRSSFCEMMPPHLKYIIKHFESGDWTWFQSCFQWTKRRWESKSGSQTRSTCNAYWTRSTFTWSENMRILNIGFPLIFFQISF